MNGPRRAVLLLPPAMLLATMLTACGGNGSAGGELNPNGSLSNASPGTSASAAPPSAVPTEQVFKAVLEQYQAYRKAYQRAYENNDPAVLSAVAMDPLLSRVTKDIERTRAKGEIWRFTTISSARVYARAKDGSSVFVLDCVRTLGGYRYSAETGKRIGGGRGGGAFLSRTAVRYDSGTWKVADTTQDKKC